MIMDTQKSKYDFNYLVIDSDNEAVRRFEFKESADYFAETIGGKVIKIDWYALEGHLWEPALL